MSTENNDNCCGCSTFFIILLLIVTITLCQRLNQLDKKRLELEKRIEQFENPELYE